MITYRFYRFIRILGLIIPFLIFPFSLLSFFLSFILRDDGGTGNDYGSPEYLKFIAMRQKELVNYTIVLTINMTAIVLVFIVLLKKRKTKIYNWKLQVVILYISIILIAFYITKIKPLYLLEHLNNN